MATKTTKAAPKGNVPAGFAKSAEERAAIARAASNDKFVYLGKVVEGAKKLAPQAEQIVNLIQAAGKTGITREALVKKMEGVVTTKQPLSRILGYYQKEIQDKGHVTCTKAAIPAAAKKAPKEAPAAEEEGAGDDE